MELDIVAGLECGADDYITKPFSLMVLRARIRALLRRNTQDAAKEYHREPFQFRFETMEFSKNGQLLTREQLMNHVWPDGTEYVEDNALSVGIRRLRDKLEDTPSKPQYIKTVYGKGYVWETK